MTKDLITLHLVCAKDQDGKALGYVGRNCLVKDGEKSPFVFEYVLRSDIVSPERKFRNNPDQLNVFLSENKIPANEAHRCTLKWYDRSLLKKALKQKLSAPFDDRVRELLPIRQTFPNFKLDIATIMMEWEKPETAHLVERV